MYEVLQNLPLEENTLSQICIAPNFFYKHTNVRVYEYDFFCKDGLLFFVLSHNFPFSFTHVFIQEH